MSIYVLTSGQLSKFKYEKSSADKAKSKIDRSDQTYYISSLALKYTNWRKKIWCYKPKFKTRIRFSKRSLFIEAQYLYFTYYNLEKAKKDNKKMDPYKQNTMTN